MIHRIDIARIIEPIISGGASEESIDKVIQELYDIISRQENQISSLTTLTRVLKEYYLTGNR